MPTTGTPTDTALGSQTGTLAPGTTLSRMKEQGMNDSTMSIKSGVRGPYAGQADGSLLGSEPQSTGASSTLGGALPDRSAQRYVLVLFFPNEWYADSMFQFDQWAIIPSEWRYLLSGCV